VNGIEIVVVGASLGGLKAFELLLRALPPRFESPVVLVQHRRPESDGTLVELMRRHCQCPVVEPEDRAAVEQGCVYVAPASYHLLLDRSSFWLSIDPPVWFARPSIDVLFESAADAFGPAALAVVLTGASEDGAAGAHAVKRAGGRVLVQSPETAESPVAPRAALARTAVDGVLSVTDIAAIIAGAVGSR
jgi:two-component system, chemotaxis family, protein-glutamate methylesterase/glutaminase